jgi:hypothetical protein
VLNLSNLDVNCQLQANTTNNIQIAPYMIAKISEFLPKGPPEELRIGMQAKRHISNGYVKGSTGCITCITTDYQITETLTHMERTRTQKYPFESRPAHQYSCTRTS